MIARMLQQVAAAATPALMALACGLIAIGLVHDSARTSDRMLELAREWREQDEGSTRRAQLRTQIVLLNRRHGFFALALLLNFSALFAFVLTSLLWISALFWRVPSQIPAMLYGLGVTLLVGMAIMVIASISLGTNALRMDIDEIVGSKSPEASGGPNTRRSLRA